MDASQRTTSTRITPARRAVSVASTPKHENDWSPYAWPETPIRVRPQPRRELLKLRLFILCAAAALVASVAWLLCPDRIGDSLAYALLTAAFLLRAGLWAFEWYNYWSISVPEFVPATTPRTVDVLTTACPGEPFGMIERTLRAMVAIRLPHESYLCDEGNDPALRALCDSLGVIHVTRTEKRHAKAGNINNALRQCRGEIVVVLDPDHEPSPYLLERTLGYFDDDRVGFLQSVQGYRNQSESFVARGAAEQSYHFYGPIMLGMHGRQTTQAIGANCVFRREALDRIGGHAAGLAEDMHTAMRLYSAGWSSVYVPEILTRGLVPSSLGAFLKQQVKWSCGAFDLLFQEYPSLWRGFTWRQRLHYFMAPVYFLRGFITLLEVVVPMLCLLVGFVAWRTTPINLAIWMGPALVFGLLVRARAQRWLLEPHERGAHLVGGVLSTGTWWIYNLGVLCAVLRIKVPYIPTPKDDVPTDAPAIVIPNVLTALALLAAAAYGTYLDSSPASLAMAGLASLNAVALTYVSIAAQRATLLALRRKLSLLRTAKRALLRPVRVAAAIIHGFIFDQLRERSLPLLLALVLALISLAAYRLSPKPTSAAVLDVASQRKVDGFYAALDLPLDLPASEEDVRPADRQLDFRFRLSVLHRRWSPKGPVLPPLDTLRHLRDAGTTPVLSWDASGPFDIHSILSGSRDASIRSAAAALRDYGDAVLIRPFSCPDVPNSGTTPSEWLAAFHRVVGVFREEGASNVGWVLPLADGRHLDTFDPGEGYVDWVELDPGAQSSAPRSLSFGPASRAGTCHHALAAATQPAVNWQTICEANHHALARRGLPVILTLANVDAPAEALSAALARAQNDFPEIKAVVLSAPDNQRPGEAAKIATSLRSSSPATEPAATLLAPWDAPVPAPLPGRRISGAHGAFQLVVDGKPFYIRGVSYNPGHDWRDAETPLSRRELSADMAAIKAMGANTIRRYGETWSDRNIFNVADENGLKVLSGFYFEPDIEYGRDTAAEANYERAVLEQVRAYRHHHALLGWCLGNEVWGLLKHHFAQPHLTEVRHGYVRLVERLAREIREIDPDHPILVANEGTSELPGAFADFARGAPDLDAIGVNCFYESDIAAVAPAARRFDPTRPYLISEYGPDGYWDETRNAHDDAGGLLEATAAEKAEQYARRWREHVLPNAGNNIGGIAYCWRDRYEGTPTWFGITDLDGRRKPAYDAIAASWRNASPAIDGGARILNVTYPAEPAVPNASIELHAEVRTPADARFAWSICGADFASISGSVHVDATGRNATVRLPSTPGWYRVQVKVITPEGLDEADVPILVAVPRQTASRRQNEKPNL